VYGAVDFGLQSGTQERYADVSFLIGLGECIGDFALIEKSLLGEGLSVGTLGLACNQSPGQCGFIFLFPSENESNHRCAEKQCPERIDHC